MATFRRSKTVEKTVEKVRVKTREKILDGVNEGVNYSNTACGAVSKEYGIATPIIFNFNKLTKCLNLK